MKFAEIIDGLKEGKKFRRKAWSRQLFITPGEFQDIVYYYRNLRNGISASRYEIVQSDLFADDWEEVE